MTVDPLLLLVQEHQDDLRAQARRDRLVRLVRCCRPSAVGRALRRWRDTRPATAEPAGC